jgi:DNA-binding XRE family transcriptional regulator
MPFEKVDVRQTISDTLTADPELKQLWDESRTEYHVLGELVKLRKSSGISQTELAEKSGNKQQVISRIEKRENSPTLKTLCSILDVLGYDIQFVPRQRV